VDRQVPNLRVVPVASLQGYLNNPLSRGNLGTHRELYSRERMDGSASAKPAAKEARRIEAAPSQVMLTAPSCMTVTRGSRGCSHCSCRHPRPARYSSSCSHMSRRLPTSDSAALKSSTSVVSNGSCAATTRSHLREVLAIVVDRIPVGGPG